VFSEAIGRKEWVLIEAVVPLTPNFPQGLDFANDGSAAVDVFEDENPSIYRRISAQALFASASNDTFTYYKTDSIFLWVLFCF
jgi:hypothetical protein